MFYKLNDYNAICIDIESKDECAKQCALIAVDEILQQILWDKAAVKYWNEVKQEIEAL